MKKEYTFLLFLLNTMFALNIHTFSNQNTDVEINQISNERIDVEFTLNELGFDIIKNESGNFTRINIANHYATNTVGQPELPQLNNLIEIPHEADININLKSEEFIDFNLKENGYPELIYPAQRSISKSENPEDIKFSMDRSVYNLDDFIYNDIIQLKDKGVMRYVRIGNLMVTPFKYNPKTGVLRIYTKISFSINFENVNDGSIARMKEKYYSPYFEPIFNASIHNYSRQEDREDDMIESQVTYVIISDPIFENYLDDFIDWKTKKGYNVIVGYTDEIGSSASNIRSFISNLYNNPGIGVAPPSFVLLVGDTQQIPASYSSGGHVSDLDYCDFTNDNIPEILHGRFSASNPAQLTVQIDKTIQYEQYTMPDPSFLQDVIMISGVDSNYAPTYGNGQINYGNSYYFNFTNGIDSHTFLYPESGSSGSTILNLANQGSSFMNYTAHGYEQGWADPAFDNNDVGNMTNNHKYPTMVGNCCLTNAFDTGTCFGEALLRKSGGGAIGYIGGSDVTYWNEDYWWGVGSGNITSNPNYNSSGEGAYDGIFHEQNEDKWAVVNSAIMFVGNLAVAEANGMDDYYWEIYHLMGDPSLSTYFGVPSANNVDHAVFLPVGTDAIEIQADPFSYVGVTQDGNLLGSGTVDDDGYLVLIFNSPITQPGMIDIVVTAQNKEPYEAEILIASPDGAFVTVNNIDIDYGNDNSISPGETIDVTVEIENLGNESSSFVEVTLYEMIDNPYITIIDGYESINNLSDGSLSYFNLSFSVSNSAPFGHSFALQLDLESEENNSSSTLVMTVEALVESFEDASFSNSAWEFDGDADWTIDGSNQFDGTYSARSGSIDNDMTSDLILTVDVVEDGQITFYKKVSCEDVGNYTGNYYDYLAFYIDGIEQGRWAGEISWSSHSFPVSAGEHTFMWRYNKDQGVVAGDDAVWIDNIIFPPTISNSGFTLGDINDDGVNNVLDIILLVNIILGVNESNPAADMNNDGVINVLDVVSLVNLILEG